MMRRLSLIVGLFALAGAWVVPWPASFTAHMTKHMIVVAVAAPFLALGIAGRRIDPVRRWPAWFPPIPMSLIELVVVWAWHAPALHHVARHTIIGLGLEQASFLISGGAVWLSVFGGDRFERGDRVGAGIAALLLTSMHMTLLGALLALTPRALYAGHGGGAVSTIGAIEDQHLGGAIMLIVGGVSYLAGALVLMREWLRAPPSGLRRRREVES